MAQKKNFISGINGDLANEFLPEGVDRYRLNVRVISNSAGEYGVLTTCNGNVELDYSLPSGDNICIGTKEYEPTKKTYAFIFNSLGSHSILEYDYANNVVACVMQDVNDTYLKFKASNLITGINIVRLTNESHLLYWTDNYQNPITKEDYNEPKKINIEKGKYYMQGNYVLGYPNVSGELLWEFFHRIKQPPMVEPSVLYANDPDVNVNLLTDVNSQKRFKAKFVYDDDEESRWSPISVYAEPLNTFGATSPTLNNHILVTIPTGIEIVKRIKIAVQGVNETDFSLAVDLDKELLNIPSNSTYTYKFYNDGIYLPIEINDSIQLYDRVPKRSLAQEIVQGNRMVDGNITEEFDPVPIDMKLDLSFAEDIKSPTFPVTGKIYIPNLRNSAGVGNNKYQPIYHSNNTGDNCVWGGVGYNTSIWIEGITQNVPDYQQILPENGFYVYFAGTNYDTISTQHITGAAGQTTAHQGRYELGDTQTLTPNSSVRALQDEITAGNVYSTFTIYAPVGSYILRISNERDQNKSTYVCGVGGYDVPYNGNVPTECLLEIKADGTVTINGVDYPNGEIPDTFVLDLTAALSLPNPTPLRYSVLNGYLKDNDGEKMSLAKVDVLRKFKNGTPSSDNNTQTTTMFCTNAWGTNAIDRFINGSFFQSGINASTPYGNTYVITDHNGFFYQVGANITPATHKMQVDGIQSGVTTRTYTSSNFVDDDGAATTQVNLTTFDPNGRTYIEGYVTNNGQPIGGVRVTATYAGYSVTDYNGYFKILVYPTIYSTERIAWLSYSLINNAVAFWNGGNPLGLYIDPIDSWNYNNSNYFTAPTLNILGIVGDSPEIALKRGGNYVAGIIYYDHANRSGLTNINDWDFNSIDSVQNKWGTKLFVPFFTEINPNTSSIYGGSYPFLQYSIFNQAPAWAKWWRFALAKNTATQKYIDFVINSVQYLDVNGSNTSYGAAATQVKIGVSNIYTSYKTANSNSILSYDFVKGQRIIFYRKENGDFLNDYFNMEVKSFDSGDGTIICEITNSMPELHKGYLFEIYNPSKQVNSSLQITYEVGESNRVTKVGNYYIHEGETNQGIWGWTGAQNSGGFVRLNNLIGNTLSVGDYIRVQQRNNYTNAYYNTYATVTGIPAANAILTDIPFVGTITSTGTVSLPAKGYVYNGDTFYRFRNMEVEGGSKYNLLIQDANYSDFYESPSWFFGRPNRIDPLIKEINRPNTINYSLPFVPETQINGLSNVYDNMFQDYYHQFAPIQKFVYKNIGLICYMELKVIRIPIEQNIYQGTAGEQVVGASTQVLSPQTNTEVYQSDFGASKHPEAIFSHEQADYFFDINRGALCRLSNDGLTPISELYGEKTLFVELARKIKSAITKVKCLGIYDTKYNEYILNVPSFTYIENDEEIQFEGLCIAFNELKNVFSTFYSFEASEYFGRAATNIFSVKNGTLWLHDVNPIQNNFYGTQYKSKVSQIVNENPLDVKVLQAVEVESKDEWLIPSITTENGQETRMNNAANWVKKENQRYAFVKNNLNTPNVANPIINGNPLRDRTFKIDLEYSGTDKAKIFSVNYKYITSNLHNQ